MAADGDVVVIAAGDYRGDVATWRQNHLALCGSGGRARLFADGVHAGGKGIWVIQGANVVVDSVEFHGARVPDRNGAGIRAEGNGLTIINAGFFDNENGMLGPNAGDLSIVRSEFARNGMGERGYTHNLYVGYANRVTVTSSFFHQAFIGHNFKSRARETRIENSYFMDGTTGTASYQVDVPNGGAVYLRGNLLQKGLHADNSTLLNFGSEGALAGATHTLTLVHNTLVSTYSGGTFVNAASFVQSIELTANLFAGTGAAAKVNGAAVSKVTERHSVAAHASDFPGATDPAALNFWPSAALAQSTVLNTVPDPGYTTDSPAPARLRAIDTNAGTRRAGALQAAP